MHLAVVLADGGENTIKDMGMCPFLHVSMPTWCCGMCCAVPHVGAFLRAKMSKQLYPLVVT